MILTLVGVNHNGTNAMPAIGDYDYLLTRRAATPTRDTTSGQVVYEYADNGNFWGNVEINSSGEEEVGGVVRTVVNCTVYAHGLDTGLVSMDLIVDEEGAEYEVRGVHKDKRQNETVVDCVRYEPGPQPA